MFVKRANSFGAICGLAGSMVVQLLVMHGHWVNLLLYSTTGFISCFMIGAVASLLTPDEHKAGLISYSTIKANQ
jgi:Na+/proline symporter